MLCFLPSRNLSFAKNGFSWLANVVAFCVGISSLFPPVPLSISCLFVFLGAQRAGAVIARKTNRQHVTSIARYFCLSPPTSERIIHVDLFFERYQAFAKKSTCLHYVKEYSTQNLPEIQWDVHHLCNFFFPAPLPPKNFKSYSFSPSLLKDMYWWWCTYFCFLHKI